MPTLAEPSLEDYTKSKPWRTNAGGALAKSLKIAVYIICILHDFICHLGGGGQETIINNPALDQYPMWSKVRDGLL